MFEPAHPFEAALSPGDLLCFQSHVLRADRISLALYGQRVMPEPGAKVRTRIAEALKTLAPITVHGMYSTNAWLGTSQRSSLVVFIELNTQLRNRLSEPRQVFFALSVWEDLALYSSERILLWTCTHEREGIVYGEAAKLQQMKLTPRPARKPRFLAEPLDDAAKGEILALITR